MFRILHDYWESMNVRELFPHARTAYEEVWPKLAINPTNFFLCEKQEFVEMSYSQPVGMNHANCMVWFDTYTAVHLSIDN